MIGRIDQTLMARTMSASMSSLGLSCTAAIVAAIATGKVQSAQRHTDPHRNLAHVRPVRT